MKVIDPVCGMEVDTEKPAAVSSYKGQEYYFCSAMCREVFDREAVDLLKTQEEISNLFLKFQTGAAMPSPPEKKAAPLEKIPWTTRAAETVARQPAWWGTGMGVISGFIILHPYAMLVEHFTHITAGTMSIFAPEMIPMTMAFVLFGGALGGMAGNRWHKARQLEEARVERERRKAAVDILRQLMVTLSHYITNSTTAIGGFARRGLQNDRKQEIVEGYLRIIGAESERIRVVINSLNSVISADPFAPDADEAALMLTLQQEITGNMSKLTAHFNEEARRRWGTEWEKTTERGSNVTQ